MSRFSGSVSPLMPAKICCHSLFMLENSGYLGHGWSFMFWKVYGVITVSVVHKRLNFEIFLDDLLFMVVL
jgi:hypothetical protein